MPNVRVIQWFSTLCKDLFTYYHHHIITFVIKNITLQQCNIIITFVFFLLLYIIMSISWYLILEITKLMNHNECVSNHVFFIYFGDILSFICSLRDCRSTTSSFCSNKSGMIRGWSFPTKPITKFWTVSITNGKYGFRTPIFICTAISNRPKRPFGSH